MYGKRQLARELVIILILLLIPAALYMIVQQPNFTPSMALFRMEEKYGIHLTRVTEVEVDLDREDWNYAQERWERDWSPIRYAPELWYLGRAGEGYAAFPLYGSGIRWRCGEPLRLSSAEEPVVTDLRTEKEMGTLAWAYVFGVVLDPEIVRVELTYRAMDTIPDNIYTIGTTEFYDGMFLLCPGDWYPEHFDLAAYDAAGELVFRDTRWETDEGWIDETYIRP